MLNLDFFQHASFHVSVNKQLWSNEKKMRIKLGSRSTITFATCRLLSLHKVPILDDLCPQIGYKS